DLAVAICIAGATHADEQVVREVARLQLLALLRELAAGRRREHRDALRIELRARVEREVGRGLRTLDARERAALTRVEHHDREGGVRGEQLAAELLEGQRLVAE